MNKSVKGFKSKAGPWRKRLGLIVLAIVSVFGMCVSADAFEIQTGNEDFKANWDNSIRYNLGYRVGSQDGAIVANPNLDDGDRNFKSGIVQNRVDILSEFDISYKKSYGIRLSGAGWYDQRYHDNLDNTSLGTSNHFENGNQSLGLNGYVKRQYAGPDGELLDAFVFGKFSIADVPFDVKVGRHTLYFGESLLLTAALNGISYAMSPLDIAKGLAVPGTNVKELFRPLNSISATAQITSTLSITGQYFLQWEPNRYPEAGTYLGLYDFVLNGSESILDPGLGIIRRGDDITPYDARDYAIALRLNPEWLEGTTIGFYYRNFSDRSPQFHVNLNPVLLGLPAQFNIVYPSNIDLYGMSLSKQILGFSVGAELSYRQNMPLSSESILVATAANAAALGLAPGSFITDLPGRGNTGGTRGNTWHGVLSLFGMINRTPLFDSAQWVMEYSWNRWDQVTQNEAVFKGRDGYKEIDRVTKDALGVDISFTPTWYQVFPGADFLLPISYSRGLSGNSATGVSNEGAGSWSVALGVDLFSRYRIDLTYADYFGKYTKDSSGAVTLNNGDAALLRDRGTISLTLRTTF